MSARRRTRIHPVTALAALVVLAVILAHPLLDAAVAGLAALWLLRDRITGLPQAARLRRQVAKLEADAARHDQLLDELEDAAGRPAEAVIASYRHLQARYDTKGRPA